MELRLYTSDLLPRYRDTIPCSATRFGHFNKKAQRAILAVGEAMYFTNQNTNYNKIFTPRVQMQIRLAKWVENKKQLRREANSISQSAQSVADITDPGDQG